MPSIILGNPVRGTIYLTAGTVDGHARWFRSQRFGCTGFSAERPLGNCAHYHRGVDIARGAAGCGDDILNMFGGKVVYAGTLNDGAKAVVVYHGDGIATGHVHMSSLGVSVGQSVAKGARLGAVGATGNATGCHDHVAGKTGFPGDLRGSAAANAFWPDGVGKWFDIWPNLAQNVKVRPLPSPGIRLRTAPDTASSIYATVEADGHIRRASDGADLGLVASWRAWGGEVSGASYSAGGASSSKWHKLAISGAPQLYVAALLSQLSV